MRRMLSHHSAARNLEVPPRGQAVRHRRGLLVLVGLLSVAASAMLTAAQAIPLASRGVVELFIAHKMLESWAEQGKAELGPSSVKLDGRGLSRSLVPAVHILALVSGDDAPRSFLGTVRTEAELEALGGELYFDSLLVGEDAYTVERGFLAAF